MQGRGKSCAATCWEALLTCSDLHARPCRNPADSVQASTLTRPQRRLLERLTALAASVLGGCVPVGVVTLEALGLLLEVWVPVHMCWALPRFR